LTFTAQRSVFGFGGSQSQATPDNTQPKRIAVTGATGNISYSVLFRLAAGEFLGKQQRVILHLIDLPGSEQKLKGVTAELHDCAFPLLDEVVIATDLN
jgi:malate dehydrogenase